MHFCRRFLLFVFCALRRYFFFCVPLCHPCRKSRLKLKRRRKNSYFVLCALLYVYCGVFVVFSSVCLYVYYLLYLRAYFLHIFYIFVQFCPIYIMCRKKVLLNTITFYSFLLFFLYFRRNFAPATTTKVAAVIYLLTYEKQPAKGAGLI